MIWRTWVKFSICRKEKESLKRVAVTQWQWGYNSAHLGPNGRRVVSVGDSVGHVLPGPLDLGMERMDMCSMWVGGGVDTHAFHLSQLTLRICLRGTSPPRPIHQAGPNTLCATVDMGLTTWHWQRWVSPAAEWRSGHWERWIGPWSTFNLNYCKYFHLAENWVHYQVYTLRHKWLFFIFYFL